MTSFETIMHNNYILLKWQTASESNNYGFEIERFVTEEWEKIDSDGTFEYSQIIHVNLNSIPKRIELMQNYPNPFNPSSKISYAIANPSFVSLKIYDVLGREVRVLVNEHKDVGRYSLIFEANDLPSGVYFIKLQAGDFVDTKKMIVMR